MDDFADTKVVVAGSVKKKVSLTLSVDNDSKKSFGLAVLKGSNYDGVKIDGFAISSVSPDGLAAEAGIQMGDLLLSVNDVAVTSSDDLFKQLNAIPHSAKVTFKLERYEQPAVVEQTVAEWQASFVSGKLVKHPLGLQKKKGGFFSCCGSGMIQDVMVTELEASQILKADAADKVRIAAAEEAVKNAITLTIANDKGKSFGISILKGVDYQGIKQEGFVVSNLSPDGLAAAAGVKVGDRLLAVNEVEIIGQDPLFKQLKTIADGANVHIKVAARV